MRILIISPLMPYPLNDGASHRIYNILKLLAHAHEITLAVLTMAPKRMEYITALNGICKALHVVEIKRSPTTRLLDILGSPFREKPYLANIYNQCEMTRIVERYGSQVDVAQAEFAYICPYITGLTCKKILDEHNVEWDLQKRIAEAHTHPIAKFSFLLQYRKMKRLEHECVLRVDKVLTTSINDRQLLEPLNPNVSVIPNCVDRIYKPVSVSDNNRTVTYIGLMNYLPNVDAMLFFSKSIWPILKKIEKDVNFYIIGKNPPARIRGLNGYGISVTGSVPDVKVYLRRTAVFIAPIRMGGGTRIKILEAMSHGIPVVSTSMGCMGLDVTDGDNILIADDPKVFAEKILYLLGNKDERIRIGLSGRELVRSRYTWAGISDEIERVYRNGN